MITQRYTVTYNTPQTTSSFLDFGQYMDTAVISYIAAGLSNGNITIVEETLSDDGMSAVVERQWTDDYANGLLAITSIDDMVAACISHEDSASITGNFGDISFSDSE